MRRIPTAAGWTATMIATSDRIDTSGSSHWYTYPAVT